MVDARAFARGPREALAAAKMAIRAALLTPGPEGLAREVALFRDLFGTPDQREGMRAFLDKREPRFGGTAS
jgi:enoyl-CoA hydratase